MKNFTLLFLGSLLISGFMSQSQISPLAADYLEINTLKVKVYADGGLWEMQTKDDTVYKNLLFAQNLWIGGYDVNTLHMAAQTYRQQRVDFSPGPVSDDPNVYTQYNKVYRIKLQTITDFVNGHLSGIPSEIANWPAHGDTLMGEAFHLAPFVDVNLDNIYNPQAGDYPDIKGDEAVFVIFNDKNGKTAGTEMGIEIHAMFYGYKTGSIEDSIIYMEYQVFNRSSNSYTDTYFSSFADFDNGNASDDLTGTNIWANSIFAYNADLNDDTANGGFGYFPASSGIRLLKGPPADYFDGIDNDKDGCIDGIRDVNGNCITENPATNTREYISLSNSMVYGNSMASLGNPNNSLENYYYMKSLCQTGILLQAGIGAGLYSASNSAVACHTSGAATAFVYPGNSYDSSGAYQPSSPTNWFAPPTTAYDMRMLANAGPFTFQAGDSFTATYAFVWNRADSNTSGYDEINHRLENLDSLYHNQPDRTVGLPTYYPRSKYRLEYRNKEWVIFNEENTSLHFKLYNTTGQLIEIFTVEDSASHLVPTSSLAHGVYFIVNEGSARIDKIMM